MVRLEPFKGAQGAGTSGRLWCIGGGKVWRVWFGAGIGGMHCLDTHCGRAEVEVEEGEIGSIMPLDLVHMVGYERKRGGGLDIVGSRSRNFMYWTLNVVLTSMGRLLTMLDTRAWVRATL